MKTIPVAALAAAVLMFTACSRPVSTTASATEALKRIAIPVARAEMRMVPAGFDVTGTFAADESSNVAPPVAGRVIGTPVNAGDFVRRSEERRVGKECKSGW